MLEAMVAIAIFFIAIFAILDLVSRNVRAAHSLNQLKPSPGEVAAALSLTNKLEEGFETGDFEGLYPGYDWAREVLLYGTNGMFEVNIVVNYRGKEDSRLSLLLYRPESEQRVGDGAGQRRFSR